MIISKLQTNNTMNFEEFIKELKTHFKINQVKTCHTLFPIEHGNENFLYIEIPDFKGDEDKMKSFLEMRNFLLSNGYNMDCFKSIDTVNSSLILLYSNTNGINQNAIRHKEKNPQIEERITSAKKSLYDLREDATRLLNNIDSALEHIDEIKTEEDMYDFIKNHEIEEGLEYIDIDI